MLNKKSHNIIQSGVLNSPILKREPVKGTSLKGATTKAYEDQSRFQIPPKGIRQEIGYKI